MPQRRRILVVEDDPDTQGAISELLTRAGYAVVSAADARQAVDMLTIGLRPRLMVVDLLLPHISGTDFLDYVQRDHELRVIPRVVVTALPRGDVRVVADAIFHKPCDLNDVLEAVRRLAPAGMTSDS